MAPPRIVLASTSRYRRELVRRLGLEVEAMAPAFDERAAEAALGAASTEEVARALALGKAQSLAAQLGDALVLGGDQIAEIDGERLHKPGTAENARAQLRRLAGRTHRLVTAVALVRASDRRAEVLVDVHRLTMRPLSDEAIARYVERDQPLDCAGSYRVEELGIALFERIEGADFTAIVGLPLTLVVTLLGRLGVDVLA
jgi:septum formation protein